MFFYARVEDNEKLRQRAALQEFRELSRAREAHPFLGISTTLAQQHDCGVDLCHFVTINVTGRHFVICGYLLDRHPTTLLGDRRKRLQYWDEGRREFFFDRHRLCFEAIFEYYRTGTLLRPSEQHEDIFLDELQFFSIEPECIRKHLYLEGYRDLTGNHDVEYPDFASDDVTFDSRTTQHCSSSCQGMGDTSSIVSASASSLDMDTDSLDVANESSYHTALGSPSTSPRLRCNRCGGGLRPVDECSADEVASIDDKTPITREFAEIATQTDGSNPPGPNREQYKPSIVRQPTVLASSSSMEFCTECLKDLRDGRCFYRMCTSKVASAMKSIWYHFENPTFNKKAQLISFISNVLLGVSIFQLCFETIPSVVHDQHCTPTGEPNFKGYLFVTDTICSAWFTLEVLVGCCLHPRGAFHYFHGIRNWLDVLAVLPYYSTLAQALIMMDCNAIDSIPVLSFVRIMRLVRVLKLSRRSRSFNLLILTFKSSGKMMSSFLVGIGFCLVLFSTVIYIVERNVDNEGINSIPDAFWLTIITLCTVGYGDVVPISPLGRLVGSFSAFAGVMCLSLTSSILTQNFDKLYRRNVKVQLRTEGDRWRIVTNVQRR